MKKIYAFDFDGTLTKRDSLLAFLIYTKGWKVFLKGFALHLHLLLAMKVGLKKSGEVKQRIFSYFFAGTHEDVFNAQCKKFARNNQQLLRSKGLEKLRSTLAETDATVMIVSASIDNWVAPFFTDMEGLLIVGTQIEVKDGILTGKFRSANCRRTEKVKRILELYPERKTYYLIAYGDSSGDIEMLNFADEGYYKPFR